MNVLLVSTLDHNPGDEIIRLGQEYLLRQALDCPKFTTINKHDPRTLYDGFVQRPKPPHRFISPFLYRVYAARRRMYRTNRLELADLVVFAGAPFIWRQNTRLFPSTCANAEWVSPIWSRLFTDLTDKPVLNLAAGTSLSLPSQIDSITREKRVANFLRAALRRSALTTARDRYTAEILASMGFDVPIMPCTSLWSAEGAGVARQEAEYVVVNVMPSAVHTSRGNRVNTTHWRAMISEVISKLEKHYQVVFVSHSTDEDKIAAAWFPGRKRFYSKNPRALLEAYSKAYFGVCNRVHAGAGVATFGRPVVVIGGDTRTDLIKQFGLPAFDHREIEVETLLRAVENLEKDYEALTANLHRLKEASEKEYLARLQAALNP